MPRRMEVEVGMVLRHQHYSPDNEYNFTATCIGVNQDENKAMMSLTGQGGKWAEEWNLAHTNSGIRRREYNEVL